jgi:hypothetical protein
MYIYIMINDIKNIQEKNSLLSIKLDKLYISLIVESYDYSIHTIQGCRYMKYYELRDKNNNIIRERRLLEDLEFFCINRNYNYVIIDNIIIDNNTII